MNAVKDWLNKLFSSSSDVSSMRVGYMLCVVAAIVIAFFGLYMNKDLSSVAVLCGTFLGAGTLGKVGQSVTENSNKNDSTN